MFNSYTKLPVLLFAAALASVFPIGTAWSNPDDHEAPQTGISNAEARADVDMTYPRRALQKAQSGMAQVEVKVDRRGRIISHHVTKNTCSRVLDREVEVTIEKIESFPPPGFNDCVVTTVNNNRLYTQHTSQCDALK